LANIRIGESRSNLSSDLEICERYAQIIYGFITFHSITRIKYSADSFELVKREIFYTRLDDDAEQWIVSNSSHIFWATSRAGFSNIEIIQFPRIAIAFFQCELDESMIKTCSNYEKLMTSFLGVHHYQL
jgi:hypothetical protein